MSEREYRDKPVYQGKDNHGHPKSEYLDKLAEMSDEDLYQKCEDMIWFSAYANNNARSDYHWQCDACYDECSHRGRVDIYERAHRYHMGGV